MGGFRAKGSSQSPHDWVIGTSHSIFLYVSIILQRLRWGYDNPRMHLGKLWLNDTFR